MDIRTDDRGKFFTPRIAKESVAAAIRTNDHMIVGQIYIRPEQRLKDELNNSQDHYLAITDARVYDASGTTTLFETSFLLVSNAHVIFISPLEAINESSLPGWAQHQEGAE